MIVHDCNTYVDYSGNDVTFAWLLILQN